MSELDDILGSAADRWKSATNDAIQSSRTAFVSNTAPSSITGTVVIGIAIISAVVMMTLAIPSLFEGTVVEPVSSQQPSSAIVTQQQNVTQQKRAVLGTSESAVRPKAPNTAERLELRRHSTSLTLVELEHRADSLVGHRPAEAATRYNALAARYQQAGDSTAVRRLRAKATQALLPLNP